jgi:hypothetical protein
MENTIAITGATLFVHLVERFNMTGSEAIQKMEENNQDLKWFDELSEEMKLKILNHKPFNDTI